MSTTRPILFSGPMVRALLAGTKTQTRRIVKALIEPNGYRFDKAASYVFCHNDYLPPSMNVMQVKVGGVTDWAHGPWDEFCPYGKPGDRLWVKETFCQKLDDGGCFVYNAAGNLDPSCYYYAATHDGHLVCGDGDGGTKYNKDGSEASPWSSPLFMPRAASRISLDITGVRVERLNTISQADARAEGCDGSGNSMGSAFADYVTLWESINGPGSWDANPWAWVVEFKRAVTP